MCAGRRVPVVPAAPPSASANADVVVFARVLQEVFHGQPWEDVEPSARRAWGHIAQITGVEWEVVGPDVRRAWQPH